MGNVLAFDQSYERTGIAVLNAKRELLDIACIDFTKKKKLEPWEKRAIVARIAHQWCEKYQPTLVAVERVRLFSTYSANKRPGIALPTIIALSKMNGAIVNAVRPFGVPVYSLDTKQWKQALFARIPGKDMKDKGTSVWYIQQNFKITVDHDAAEAACIALASFDESLLEKET